MKIGVKEVGKPVQYIEIEDIYRYDCAAKMINNKIHITPQFVYLTPDCLLSLAVDEDGLARELPTNFLLSMPNSLWPIQKMVGTAVFIRTKPVIGLQEIWDYEIDDLTAEDIQLINHILSDSYQKPLEEKFEDYGKGKMVCVPFNRPF